MSKLTGLLIAVIGVLVVLFRLQGSKLHATQIKLLLLKTDETQKKANADVQAARDRLQAALSDYHKANPVVVRPPDPPKAG